CDWAGRGPTGEAGLPEAHLYARDLDVVGEASLFQLLDTTVSSAGASTLRAWLLDTTDAASIRARQEVVQALRPEVELRERVALLADVDAEDGAAAGRAGSPQLLDWA